MIIEIPRVLVPNGTVNSQLHVFSDGSKFVSAAVAIIRNEMQNGEIECNLLFSKNRLAPITGQTIVRMELDGATLASKLFASIQKESTIAFSRIYFWIDSVGKSFENDFREHDVP